MSTTAAAAPSVQQPPSCGRLNDYQLAILFKPVSRNRVRRLKGQSHMVAWDIRRELIRVFGFGGYSTDTRSLELVTEHSQQRRKKGKDGNDTGETYLAWTVVYRAQVRLTVYATDGREITHFEDGAAGAAHSLPSLGDAHDFALKTALSQALKRCAANLGDQFGLALYDGGGARDDAGNFLPVVGWSAAHPPQQELDSRPEQPEDPPVQAEPEGWPQARAAAAESPPEAPAEPSPPPGEDPDEWKAALAAVWDAARDADFTDGLPAQFERAFGHPLTEGTTAELDQARDLMTGSST